jgi:uncharacterized protein YjbI with pentapeptide repeats
MIRELLQRHTLVIVQADFGHGKSLSARRLARDFARDWLDATTPGPENYYPIFVKCARDVHDNYRHEDVLRGALFSTAADVLGTQHPKGSPLFAPDQGQRTLVILDGLDEIAYTLNQLKDLFIALRESLTERHRAVLFTRPGALHYGCIPKDTPVIHLKNFGDNQINEWLTRWASLAEGHEIGFTDIVRLDALELARVPLLLLMIATIGQVALRDSEGLDRADIYTRFFKHVARGKFEADNDEHTGIKQASETLRVQIARLHHIGLPEPTDAMLWLMSRIAWEDHVLAQESPYVALHRYHVDAILAGELQLPLDIAPKVNIGLLLALQYNPSGETARILFGHQSFREFLVAYYWCHQLKHLGKPAMKRQIVEQLMRARLLGDEADQAFLFFTELAPTIIHDVEAKIIHAWAELEVNNESLSGPTLWLDRRYILRENCLAIGCAFDELPGIELEHPGTLRSIWVCFLLRNAKFRICAPWLQAPGADLHEIRLESPWLEGANLKEANLVRANLANADLQGANLQGTYCESASFDYCNLHGADLRAAYLYGTQFKSANLENADLRDAKLVDADFERANLSRANLSGADLTNAGFQGADLEGANLSDANLSGADLSGANLSGADLSGVDFEGADLPGSNLQGANLQGADFKGADLSGANLSDADLSGASVEGAIDDSYTRWPSDFSPEEAGVVQYQAGTPGRRAHS